MGAVVECNCKCEEKNKWSMGNALSKVHGDYYLMLYLLYIIYNKLL